MEAVDNRRQRIPVGRGGHGAGPLTEERSYCIPDDIKRLVLPVFAHRILVSSRFASALRRSEEAEAVLTEIMKTVSVPL